VCAVDTFCCDTAWDHLCVDQCHATSTGCGEPTGCFPAPWAGCGDCDPALQDCVCTADPFCCETQWDKLCAQAFADSCGGCPECAAQETVCDGQDDDCDGEIDEGFDQDDDGWTTCAGDCDDGAPDVHPGAAEVCDGVDNTCDGEVDEIGGVSVCFGPCDDGDACTVDDQLHGGDCFGTPRDCDDADPCSDDACEPGVGCVHMPLQCADDGNPCTDDRCDAATGDCVYVPNDFPCDDDNACTADLCDPELGCVHADLSVIGSPCSAGQGECRVAGQYVCAGPEAGWECVAQPGVPQEELCDGLDNDCDGETDEDIAGLGDLCHESVNIEPGAACATFGHRVCASDGQGTTCAFEFFGQLTACADNVVGTITGSVHDTHTGAGIAGVTGSCCTTTTASLASTDVGRRRPGQIEPIAAPWISGSRRSWASGASQLHTGRPTPRPTSSASSALCGASASSTSSSCPKSISSVRSRST